ncbi:MAG TPA: carboxypeptidase-like regulatory domain-containing protein [Kofleriaceae bacterium]
MKAIAVLLLLAGVAHADPRADAERYFRAGAQAYAAQSFAAAAADFDEAYRAMPLPEIAFSGAQAYRRLYRVEPKAEYVRRAVELYRAYLDQVKTGGRVGDAADNLAEMQRELDKLHVGDATVAAARVERTRIGVSVVVDSKPSDALREIGDTAGAGIAGLAVALDGKPIEPFALVDTAAATHTVKVTAPGFAPIERSVVAVAGQSQLVEVQLVALPAHVRVTTDAGARIAIDGRTVATAPAAAIDVAAGAHLIAIVRDGRIGQERELMLTRGEDLALAAPLAKTRQREAVPWVLGGAGVLAAGAVATGVLAFVHDGRASDLRDDLAAGNRPPSDADAYDRERRLRGDYATATWALGAGAVAAAGIGVALYVFDGPSTPEHGPRIAPVAAPGTAGFAVSGRF